MCEELHIRMLPQDVRGVEYHVHQPQGKEELAIQVATRLQVWAAGCGRFESCVDSAILADILSARAQCRDDPTRRICSKGLNQLMTLLVVDGWDTRTGESDAVQWIPRDLNRLADWLAGWSKRERKYVHWSHSMLHERLQDKEMGGMVLRLLTDAALDRASGECGLGGVLLWRESGTWQWSIAAFFAQPVLVDERRPLILALEAEAWRMGMEVCSGARFELAHEENVRFCARALSRLLCVHIQF